MKKLLLSFSLVAVAASAIAQKKNHLIFQVGHAIPVGSFGSTQGDNASYATTKRAVVLGYQHQFKWWYLGTQLSLFSNGFNASAYDKDIEAAIGNLAQSTTNHSGYAVVGANIVLGLNVYTDSTWYVGAHIKPGVALFLAAGPDNTTVNSTKTVYTTSTGLAESGILYTFGTQVRYKVTPSAGIIGTLDYHFGNITGYSTFNQTVNGTKTINNQQIYVKQNFNSIVFTLGLAYSF